MSERRRADEMTDPGPPPEEALDATLRALGAPVPAQARKTAESAGLDAAHYHAEPHRPPKAHEAPSSSKVAITAKMAPAVQLNIERDTIRMEPRAEPREQATVPRAKPVPSRMSTFLGALAFVVLVLGVATWALMRGGSAPERAATASSVATGAASSAAAVVVAPAPTLPAATAASAVAATAAIAPASTAPAAVASDTSSATTDPPRPTGRPQPGTTAASSAAPRHPTAATPGSPASSPLPAVPTTAAAPAAPLAPPAPTTKYNRFLEEDKK